MNSQIPAPKTQSASIANEVINLAEKVACYSDELLNSVDSKLQSVMRLDETETDKKNEVAELFPPLFEVLRKNLWRIERNLSCISKCLSRTEL